jgi:parvulin-like peptidyl-prolyl isomerase
LRLLLLPLALAAAAPAGCAGGDQERAVEASATRGEAVATLDGAPIPYEEFITYVTDIVGPGEDDVRQQGDVMSSLLDQFLEEELLRRAGEALGVAVSEAEIEAYLKEIGVTDGEQPEGPDDPAVFRAKIRRGLILQKVKDEVVLSKVQVTDGEIDDYLTKRPELLRASRTLVLRQILVEDKALADRLRKTLAADPTRFESVALEHSVAPDGGQPRSYREEELPTELIEPLLALPEGALSDVMELAQRFLIFQMVRRIDSVPLDRDELRSRVRLELFQRKVDEVLDQYLAGLVEKTAIHVNRSILPFRYEGKHPGQ